MNIDWFLFLDDEDREFIRKFVINSGSLKKIAAEYDVSYPTVRLRLNNIIDQIRLYQTQGHPFEAKIMKMVIEEKISLEVAKEIITYHEED